MITFHYIIRLFGVSIGLLTSWDSLSKDKLSELSNKINIHNEKNN